MIVIAKHKLLLEKLRLNTVAGVMAFQGERVKEHRGRRDIFRIVPEMGTAVPVLFLKRNWKAYKKDGVTSLLRHGSVWSVSREEWENSCALENAGIRVAGLVAYGEECGVLRERFSFIITETAPGQPLEEFIRGCHDRALRRRVFGALAGAVKRMHAAGLAAPDLVAKHVFVEMVEGEPRFCLIDMARMDHRRRISPRRRARDLTALHASAPLRLVSVRERVGFLRAYADQDAASLARLIERRMTHLLKRKKYRNFMK